MGYVACGVFLTEKDELLRLVINSVRTDLISRNEAFQCLALEFVANGKLLISLNSIAKKHSSSACAVTLLVPRYGILFQFKGFFLIECDTKFLNYFLMFAQWVVLNSLSS